MSAFFKYFSITLSLLIFTGNILHSEGDYGGITGQNREFNPITTAVPFLMIAPDARSGALGDAGVSSKPDVNSMHWNPAKYSFTEQDFGISMNYTPWLRSLIDDINFSNLNAFYRIDDLQTVATSLKYFSLGEINFTGEAGQDLGTVRPNEFSVDVAYSRKLGDNLSGAIAARYIYSNLTGGRFVENYETGPGQAIAADVAVYYQSELNWDTPTLFAAGLNISNIGNKISYTDEHQANFLPTNLRLGPSLTFELDDFNTITVMVDMNKLLVPTPPIYARDEDGNVKIDDDGNYIIESGKDPDRSVVAGIFGSFNDAPGGWQEELQEIMFATGVEYWYDNQFAIRAGYFNEHENKGNRKYFTAGLGLKYNVFGIDFSYIIPVAQRSPLEDVLRFSLELDFEALRMD